MEPKQPQGYVAAASLAGMNTAQYNLHAYIQICFKWHTTCPGAGDRRREYDERTRINAMTYA